MASGEIEDGLPPTAAAVLVRILPWANLIKGSRDVTAKALGMMLGLPVTATTSTRLMTFGAAEEASLGEGGLGTETVCGKSITERSLCWTFSIAEIPEARISEYLAEAPYGRLLRKFEEIFIPVETDIIFEFGLEAATVAETETEQVLGYSLLI